MLMSRIAKNRGSTALVVTTVESKKFRKLRMLPHFPEKDRLLPNPVDPVAARTGFWRLIVLAALSVKNL
jgi:hypothetical protein